MSSASKSVNITFLQKMGTFTPSIQSPDGDLYQEYQKNGDVVTVYPDFSQSQPKLYFVVISSRAADGVTTPVSMQFFFNETEIPFNSAGKSTGLFDGLFEIIRPSASQFYWGLKICNNLVKASNYTAINIKMIGKVSERSNQQEITDSVQAVYEIPVGPYTGVAYRVTIKAPENDTHNFILNSKDDSCQLEAKATQGNDTIKTVLYYNGTVQPTVSLAGSRLQEQAVRPLQSRLLRSIARVSLWLRSTMTRPWTRTIFLDSTLSQSSMRRIRSILSRTRHLPMSLSVRTRQAMVL